MLSKQLPQTAPTGDAAPPFFFPTGLSKLAAQYGGEALGVAAGELKARFSAIFGAEEGRAPGRAPGRPFRKLPLSADAVAYAALDAWAGRAIHDELARRRSPAYHDRRSSETEFSAKQSKMWNMAR